MVVPTAREIFFTFVEAEDSIILHPKVLSVIKYYPTIVIKIKIVALVMVVT